VAADLTVTWIGFAGGAGAAALSALVAVRQSRQDERLELLKAELSRRAAEQEREERAEDVLTRYRQPLAAAAFDLQSRLYNILELDFFKKYGPDHERAEEALTTTLFRLAQYFGWTEILRRDIQFLSFAEDEDTRRVATLQADIARRFLTDKQGTALMIWGDEQRAIGERMIVEKPDKLLSMGYASFREHRDDTFKPWLERLRNEVGEESARERLRDVQNLLCDLVLALDPRRVRYTQDLDRA
jgi:hypothetical protein